MHTSQHPYLAEVPTDKFGAHLGRLIPLSDLDVEEILHEQRLSQRRFGEVALSMGLCQPEHVWRAWSSQLDSHTPRVRLSKVGVDATTVKCLPHELARKFGALPLRRIDDELLVAVSHLPDEGGHQQLQTAAGQKIKLVLANESELASWLDRYYPQ
jgi:Type II secretion system (T2SS), protein E, N-terminal domain